MDWLRRFVSRVFDCVSGEKDDDALVVKRVVEDSRVCLFLRGFYVNRVAIWATVTGVAGAVKRL